MNLRAAVLLRSLASSLLLCAVPAHAGGVIEFGQAALAAPEGAGSVLVTVRRSGDVTGDAQVRFRTRDGSAKAGLDYQATSGALVFAPGQAQRTFTVTLLQDGTSEPEESIRLELTDVQRATLGAGQGASLSIRDDDAVQFHLQPNTSVGEQSGAATIAVQRFGNAAAGPASVRYALEAGSATAVADYAPASGVLSWAQGDASPKSFTVDLVDDSAAEPDETVLAVLSQPAGGTLGRKTTTLTLVSNDLPAVSVADTAVDEGNSGESTVEVVFTLDAPPAVAASVRYSLGAGQASRGTDYHAQSGIVEFAPGQVRSVVTVRVIGDTVREGNEAFKVLLSSPQRLTVAGANAAVLVRDDDQPARADEELAADALDAALRGCDLLDTAHCLFPFPSDRFTVAAAAGSVQSAARGGTGKRVDLNVLAMPRNAAGKPIDPTEWNRNDGYSPGQLIATYVEGLSLERTYGLPSAAIGVANPALSLSQPQIMVLEVPQAPEAFVPRRHLVWAEVDANANLLVRPEGQEVAQPVAGKAALLIRPAQNFREGRRYVVVLRGLRDGDGAVIGAGEAFRACRDNAGSALPPVSERCAALERDVFPVLDAAGVVRDASLYLAWDFTVASTENQLGRIRRMRDDAFASLSNDPAHDDCTQYRDDAPCRAPGFTVDKVTANPQGGIARRIEGTITVPSYLVPVDASPLEDPQTQALLGQLAQQFPEQFGEAFDAAGIAYGASLPPNRLFYSPADAPNPADPQGAAWGDGLPDRAAAGSMTTRFMCQVPVRASPDLPARAGVYGHGLLDSHVAITYDGVPELSREFNYMFCAVDWFGFATGDLPNVASTLVDLSNFPVIPDASQQGILNFAYLARLLRDARGFAAHPAFQADGRPVFDRTDVFYDGNSQGGILGGAVLALSKDVNRGVLGSLGMNYSTLLSRSVDFDLYAVPLYLAYRDPLDRDLAFSLIQMLWDRSENNGYAAHIVDNRALQGPANAAKLDPQFGDHQVTMWSADVMARTMGIRADNAQTARVAALKGQADRHPDVVTQFGLAPLDYADPAQAAGSAIVLWDDQRTEIPPITNTAPRAGRDPHDDSAKKFSGRCQKAHFLRTGGQLIDATRVEFDGAACAAVPNAPPALPVGTLGGDGHAEPHAQLCVGDSCIDDVPLAGEYLAGTIAHSLLDTLCRYFWIDSICAAVIVDTGTVSADGTPLQHYAGALHEHSSYSDGDPHSIPRDYFNAARSAGLDFLMSSEHADNEKLPITTSAACIQFFAGLAEGTLSPADAAQLAACSHAADGDHYHKWGATLAQAHEASYDRFTGVRGFEWTNDFHGHLNVYFSANVTNAKNDGGYVDMVSFWSWLQKPAAQGGGADGLVTFNHPGRDPTLSPFDSGFNGIVPPASVENWNDFEYVNAEVDARVAGMELHSEGYIDDYVRALSKGWHVGAVGAEDEHGTRWASPDQPKTVILAPSRSRADLKAAMQARHMYAVYGNHNGVRLNFSARAPECLTPRGIQGDRIDCSGDAGDGGRPVIFHANLDGLSAATVEIRSAGIDAAGRQPADPANTGAVVIGPAAKIKGVQIRVDSNFIGERWYFAVARNSAGRVVAVSSPIWVKGYRIAPAPQPLLAGVGKAAIRVPVGTPLGGYLRPPVGGDYIPGLEGFAAGDPSVFFGEFLDFLPTGTDHDGVPLAPLPDELRAIHSPYATFSPPSRGYYDSLVAKAVALFDGHDYVVLVKTDFIGMLDEVVVGVADKVKADTGIDLGDGLIMSGNHSHDGPGAIANHSTRYFWAAMDAYQPELYNRLVPELAEVVKRALADLQPARIGHAVGSEGYLHPVEGAKALNSFRRSRLPSYDLAANNAMRSRLGVLRVDTLAGAPLAVVMNFAAHGIAFDVENQYFSGDVMGAAERATESLLGVPMAMAVQNTGGDVSPRADGGPTLQRIERFGQLLAPQVKRLYDGIRSFQARPDLRAVSQRVILSRERLGYGVDEYPYPWGAAQCNNDLGVPFTGPNLPIKNPGCLAGPPPDAIDLADNGVGENGAFLPQDTRMTAAQIGNILLLAQPGEPLTEYGVRLLRLATDSGFGAADTFIWGYSQDHVGYIVAPEQADWAMGGTEGTTTFWGWKQGQRLLDASLDLMIALRDDRAPPDDEFQVNYFYQDLYALAQPPPVIPSARAGRVIAQPAAIERFQQTSFAWEGGDPVVDSPVVTLERLDTASGQWQPARRPNGDVINTFFEMHLDYRLVSGAHRWRVDFEAPKDWPAGSYRFAVAGTARLAADASYVLQSGAFAVKPSPSLQVSAPAQLSDGRTEVTLAYAPRPGNYRLIDALVPSDRPAPVRAGVVAFGNGSQTVLDAVPSIEVRGGRLVAVYSAAISGVTQVSGADAFGNLTPGASVPPADATIDNGTGLIALLANAINHLGDVVAAVLSGNLALATEQLNALIAGLAEDLARLGGGDTASLLALFTHAAENLAGGDPATLLAQAGADAGAVVGLDADPVTVLRRAGSAERDAYAVVLTGAQVPGWSQLPAQGTPYPYPSGATTTGQGPAPFDDRRDAHNGAMLYPAGWTPGDAPSGLATAAPVSEIAAFARHGDSWVEIPVQVDEKYPYFLANGNSDFSVYSGTDEELTYAWDRERWNPADSADQCSAVAPVGTPDPVAGLDDDDEIAFMWADAGEFALPGTAAPSGATGMQQVGLLDPLDPSSQKFVYLVRKAGGSSFKGAHYVRYQRDANADQWIDRSFFADDDPEKIGTSNTGYGPNLPGIVCRDGQKRQSTDRFPRDGVTVTTDAYRWTASGRWMVRGVQVARPGAAGVYGPDLVDRWKGRAFQQSPDSNISVVGFEDEQVNWEANSALLGERCGPVRCMREVWGADSGTNVTKLETFYRDAVAYRYHVRVHPIPPDGLYTSWDYNRSAMVPNAGENVPGGRYFTVLRPQGVPVDGINDDIGQADGLSPIPTPDGPLCLGSDGPTTPGANGLCRAFFDAADPTFNLALAFDNWEQVSGKGDNGSLVYTFELKGTTSLLNPLVVPYYRDDACLDDGTGDDPVQRPWPGESYTWSDGAVKRAYNSRAGRSLDYSGHVRADCLQRQGAHAAHGVHYFLTHDSDNAFVLGKPNTEIDGQQWQFMVPTSRPVNVGELYSNNVRVPIVPIVTPLPPQP